MPSCPSANDSDKPPGASAARYQVGLIRLLGIYSVLLHHDVLKNPGNLLWCLSHSHGCSINLFQRMPKTTWMQYDNRLPLGNSISYIQCGIPLPIVFAEFCYNDICFLKHGPGAYCVYLRRLVILPESIGLVTQDISPNAVR